MDRVRSALAATGLALTMVSGRAQNFPPPLRGSVSSFQWSSYVQLRYTGVDRRDDLFALRRFKMMIGGNVTPKIQWYAQGLFKDGNESPTDGRAYFQEAWVRFAFRKEVQLVAGQFKPPFGRERFTPDFQILTPDRALVTDALTPAGPYVDSFYRDRGVQVDGEFGRDWRYAIGIFDGRGANHQFHGVGPLLVTQVTKEAIRERLVGNRRLTVQMGGAAAFRWGRDLPFRQCCSGASATDFEHFRGADQRWGVETSGEWGNASVRFEYMRARLDFSSGERRDLFASGWYVQVSKVLRPNWEAVGKLEGFDPNESIVSAADMKQATFGVNYYLRGYRRKLMTAYVFRRAAIGTPPGGLLQVQLQYFIH